MVIRGGDKGWWGGMIIGYDMFWQSTSLLIYIVANSKLQCIPSATKMNSYLDP